MSNPDACPHCKAMSMTPWNSSMTARKCGICKMIQENGGRVHVDCPCWATGRYVWVEDCEGHPWSAT